MVFCNNKQTVKKANVNTVTILILIDGFLQYGKNTQKPTTPSRHNPYFNRWFSAISNTRREHYLVQSHNPYFNRWFSAMEYEEPEWFNEEKSQSLF